MSHRQLYRSSSQGWRRDLGRLLETKNKGESRGNELSRRGRGGLTILGGMMDATTAGEGGKNAENLGEKLAKGRLRNKKKRLTGGGWTVGTGGNDW